RLRRVCRRRVVPLRRLFADLRRGTLPRFAFVTPNLCHDTHSCPVRVGDGWLARFLPQLLASRTYRGGRTAVFVVWDEGVFSDHVLIAIAPSIRPGTRTALASDHYSLLRTTEDLLGLP